MSDDGQHFETHQLNPDNLPLPPARRGTGPLDYAMPWVIELRVVGTASVLQVQVSEHISVGRADTHRKDQPDINLEPYRAYQLGVSRSHATISARNSRVTVRDEDSSNGTFINGARLEPGQEYRLRHGDTLAFGKLELQVFFVVTPSSHEKNQSSFSEVVIPKVGNGQEVLIVEDDHQVAQAIGSILEEAGFRYAWRPTITEALTRVDHHLPDLVVMELILPDRSGVELVNFIRSKDANLPIVVISGASGGYQMGQAVEAGVDIFLTKPVGIDELLNGIRKVLLQNS